MNFLKIFSFYRLKGKSMDKKCNKYEAYFTFASFDEYEKHLSTCEDCKKEKIKEDQLSYLIKDSAETYKDLYKRQKVKKTMIKIACGLLLFVSFGTIANFETTQTNKNIHLITNSDTSVISEAGLPVDEYGFFDYQ